MLRVSSRQRLVSLDAFFEAVADEGGSDSEYSSDYEDVYYQTDEMTRITPILLSSSFGILSREDGESGSFDDDEHDSKRLRPLSMSPLSSGSRKRERFRCVKACQQSNNEPASASPLFEATKLVVPSLSFNEDSNLHLEDLFFDVKVYICSFLDVESVRNVMATNSKLRRFLLSTDANHLWLKFCQRQWHNTGDTFFQTTALMKNMRDEVNLPTAAGSFQDHSSNLPLLLSMTPKCLPASVDKRLVTTGRHRSRWRRNQLKFYPDKDGDESTGISFIRFTGEVGKGDRCIRADCPFPRPIRRPDVTWSSFSGAESAFPKPSLLERICRGAKAVVGQSMGSWRPFVAPYVDQDNALQISPRMVSYYEVSIFESKDDTEETDEDRLPLPAAMSQNRRNINDCVAVGVATQSFHLHSRMPGWDCLSFGYHGDDGGIFHASGGMVKQFGPSFGAGDTVGCGIDYVNQGIFFTLNGNFLGYGWTGIDLEFLQNDLYPVVGVDTNWPISCNFGSRPFSFDLTSFSAKYQELIRDSYKWTEFHTSLPTASAKLESELTTSVLNCPQRRGQRSRE